MTPDAWFEALTDAQRAPALALRDLIRATEPALSETVKWGQPCYTRTKMVCYIQKSKTHVSLGFAKGAALPDPDNMLTGIGAQMRHVKIPLGTMPDAAMLAPLLMAAIALDG